MFTIFQFIPNGFRLLMLFYVVCNEVAIVIFCGEIIKIIDNEIDEYLFKIIFIVTYFSYFGFLYNGVIIREGMAMSLAMVAFIALHKNKWIRFLLLSALAFLFHYSAFFLIVVLLVFKNIRLNDIIYYIWYIAIILIWALNLSINIYNIFVKIIVNLCDYLPFMNRFAYYVVVTTSLRLDGRKSLKDILFLIIGLWFIFRIKEMIPFERKLMNIFLIGLTSMVSLNCFFIGYRFYDYFLIFEIALISLDCVLQTMDKQKKYGIILYGCNFLTLIAIVRYLFSVL